jgi:hypothetical protein
MEIGQLVFADRTVAIDDPLSALVQGVRNGSGREGAGGTFATNFSCWPALRQTQPVDDFAHRDLKHLILR